MINDSEIVKDFQVCTLKAEHPGFVLCAQIVDLINRLEAENEWLKRKQEKCFYCTEQANKKISEIKTEAYKEFAERLNDIFSTDVMMPSYYVRTCIKNTLKELLGE